MKLPAFLMSLCLAGLVVPSAAQTDAERVMEQREEQQREWINQTRARHQAQFRRQEIACYQRFAVNDCLNESRRTEREVMADLRRQEVLINDAQRKRRAARQLLRSDQRLHGGSEP
jgi:hypothetical protein